MRSGATLNRKLSFLRAESVLSYMKGKYAALDSTRFTVKGYGKDKPLVPNVSDDAVHRAVDDAFAAKYGWVDWWYGVVLRSNAETVELDPRAPSAPS